VDGQNQAMQNGSPIRVAAAGDIHASSGERDRLVAAFESLERGTDLLLLAGDLTTCGDPDEAVVLADACRGLDVPVVAVLGNHDWHLNRTQEVAAALGRGGIRMLERSSERFDLHGLDVGVVGMKGFVGGFPDYVLPDFGEPLLREVYAETTKDVAALDRELEAIQDCDVRIVLLHYAPTTTTLEGEPRGIWAFLGSDRLAGPIATHSPDLVLHGHAHAGTLEGYIGRVPVYNVAIQVTQRDFWYFELGPRERAHEANASHTSGVRR
jgi:Icc-related predicted phosphoesterase